MFAATSFNRSRILFYNNSCCSFNLPRLKLLGLIHANPGPTGETATNVNSYQNGKPQLNINCLYMNARSIVNKIDELQVLATNMDVLAITETWLTPGINSCEILPNINFTIHRRDRFEHNNKHGGGILLAVRNTVPCVRGPDIETLFNSIQFNFISS